jgi:hypothetical protein
MSNPYFTRTFTALPFYLIPSSAHVNQWTLAETGFDLVYADINARFIASAVGLTANLPANGFRITGLPSPVSGSEPATKTYADGLLFTTALPGQTGNEGKTIVTDGTTASWDDSVGDALAILNFIGY